MGILTTINGVLVKVRENIIRVGFHFIGSCLHACKYSRVDIRSRVLGRYEGLLENI
jgi:hypothetical protein